MNIYLKYGFKSESMQKSPIRGKAQKNQNHSSFADW